MEGFFYPHNTPTFPTFYVVRKTPSFSESSKKQNVGQVASQLIEKANSEAKRMRKPKCAERIKRKLSASEGRRGAVRSERG